MAQRDSGEGHPPTRDMALKDPAPGNCEEHAREEPATPMTGKWCCRCRQWLPASAFRPNQRLLSGIDSWCKDCHAAAVRQWRLDNPEAVAEYNQRRRREY